jgi:hypothetical protein
MRTLKLVVAAAGLILAGVGGWILSTPVQTVASPMGGRIDPLHTMMSAKGLPAEHYHDFSVVFD